MLKDNIDVYKTTSRLTNKTFKGVEEYVFHFDYNACEWLLSETNIFGFKNDLVLADFLALKRIQLPDDCRYCYYATDCAEIKFCESGSYIHIYYNLVHGQNSQN